MATLLQVPHEEVRGPHPPWRVRLPVMLQSWRTQTFLHWGYEPGLVRPLVPDDLELDLHNGLAWVTLTPFLLDNLRAPGLPALPWISTTPETNVRTYVRGPDGRPGIWFFSLDIARLPAALFGRGTYLVPYVWADLAIERDGPRVRYTGRRTWPGSAAGYDITVEPGAVLPADELTDLDHFLTARFALFGRMGRLAVTAVVEHPPWPLAGARVLAAEQTLLAAAGLPDPSGDPLVHFSPGVDVRIGRPQLSVARAG